MNKKSLESRYADALRKDYKVESFKASQNDFVDFVKTLKDGEVSSLMLPTHAVTLIKEGSNVLLYDPNQSELLTYDQQALPELYDLLSKDYIKGKGDGLNRPLVADRMPYRKPRDPGGQYNAASFKSITPQIRFVKTIAAYINQVYHPSPPVEEGGVCYGLSMLFRESLVQYGSLDSAHTAFQETINSLEQAQRYLVLNKCFIQQGGRLVINKAGITYLNKSYSASAIKMINYFHKLQSHGIVSQNVPYLDFIQGRGNVPYRKVKCLSPPLSIPMEIEKVVIRGGERSLEYTDGVSSPSAIYAMFEGEGLSAREVERLKIRVNLAVNADSGAMQSDWQYEIARLSLPPLLSLLTVFSSMLIFPVLATISLGMGSMFFMASLSFIALVQSGWELYSSYGYANNFCKLDQVTQYMLPVGFQSSYAFTMARNTFIETMTLGLADKVLTRLGSASFTTDGAIMVDRFIESTSRSSTGPRVSQHINKIKDAGVIKTQDNRGRMNQSKAPELGIRK